jgi:hypothetical protein
MHLNFIYFQTLHAYFVSEKPVVHVEIISCYRKPYPMIIPYEINNYVSFSFDTKQGYLISVTYMYSTSSHFRQRGMRDSWSLNTHRQKTTSLDKYRVLKNILKRFLKRSVIDLSVI